MAFTFKNKVVIAKCCLAGGKLFWKAEQANYSLITAGLKSADPQMVSGLISFEKRGRPRQGGGVLLDIFMESAVDMLG